jgi:osmoprotectant transport system permease protein
MAAGLARAGRWGIVLLAFALGAMLQARGTLPALAGYRGEVLYLIRGHVTLAAISGALAILIGVPIGILMTRPRFRLAGNLLAQVVNLGTTIPTLAILALAMTVLGLGAPSAIFGLTALTLLPIVLNTAAGLRAVPAHLIEAARGMGMTPTQILVQVELPNALYVILAGVRTALAIDVGTVPLAFLVGGGGLGELIFTGIDLMEPTMLLAGAIPTALLAVLVDWLVGMAQVFLVPRGVNPLR